MDPRQSFESAWRSGSIPELRQYLPSVADCAANGWDRQAIFCDLVSIDQEYRWRSSGSLKTLVEDYLALATSDGTLTITKDQTLRFAAHEYQLRREAGDLGSKAEIGQRFQKYRPELDSRLDQVDTHATELPTAPVDPNETVQGSSEKPPSNLQQPIASPPAAPSKLQPSAGGDVLQRIGKYRIIRRIGTGSFAEVFLAEDESLHRQVAIKVPRKSEFKSAKALDSFLKEARTVAALKHPNILTIYDVIETPERQIYIVMEYVDGPTLDELLARETMSLAHIIDLGCQLCEALSAAHRAGLVHLDLKPANILVDRNRRFVIADFGLAVHERTQGQQAGVIAGTPAFMSPEQVRGETHWIDGRTDLWSVGVILYYAISKRLPFNATGRALFQEILEREPKPLRQIDPSLPRGIEAIVQSCLTKDLPKRIASATELADRLREQQRGDRTVVWEYILMPVGICICVIGVLLGLLSIETFFSSLVLTTADFWRLVGAWYLAIGLTLGTGPILIMLAKWTCCHWQKRRLDTDFRCRVSRHALYSLMWAVSAFGWGLPMVAIAYVWSILAAVELKKKRTWITGWSYVIATWIVAPLAAIPSTVWWLEMSSLYDVAQLTEQADAQYQTGEYEASLATNEQLQELLGPAGLVRTSQEIWTEMLKARTLAAQGKLQSADQVLMDIEYMATGKGRAKMGAVIRYWRSQLATARKDDYTATVELDEAKKLNPKILEDPLGKLLMGPPIEELGEPPPAPMPPAPVSDPAA